MKVDIEYSCRKGFSYIGALLVDMENESFYTAVRAVREAGLAVEDRFTDTSSSPYFKNSDRAAVISILRLRGIEVEVWGDESDKLREVEE